MKYECLATDALHNRSYDPDQEVGSSGKLLAFIQELPSPNFSREND
jgi:hypothetical protein